MDAEDLTSWVHMSYIAPPHISPPESLLSSTKHKTSPPTLPESSYSPYRQSATLQSTTMATFSNTQTSHPDPYKEKNLEDPSLKVKVEDLLSFIEKTKFCMLTTTTADNILASRCMALAAKEGHGLDLLFHTNTESGKTDDVASHSNVNVAFINSTNGDWASISGTASIETDREEIRKYYSPSLKGWVGDLGDGKHDGGPEDPRIGIIRVKAKTAQYAVGKHTMIGGLVEMAKGTVTGEAPSVNKLRHLSEEEIQQWRSQ
ncbi:hypothetical protein M011DRAFT_468132 [Sporormia fimetaria CBS 119925]|uniref:General stress protein FMN-binding split barrel domain-containing protein n=1 Tax=Sporormia fimetaria CBS 119925 TaxID=1340428 RepID=A0A6A6VCJ9_9PLEO|nr:hypothetical protein M011DRAFT_468132 [Sporormia fimetaria CBS 119925]